MIATSPMIWISTSWASRLEIVTGCAVSSKKRALSTSEPSAREARKASARICLEPCDVRALHRADVVVVERAQRVEVGLRGGLVLHGMYLVGDGAVGQKQTGG